MLIPAFQLHLNNSILSGLVTVGSYDGVHPELTCATTAGKVFVHSPHAAGEVGDGQLRYLNINRRITAMVAGRLGKSSGVDGDVLAVGTQANVLVYDVNENRDVFFVDTPDGTTSLLIGQLPATDPDPMIILGGSCSVLGLSSEGKELMWTVTGDVVSAMTLVDLAGSPHLVIGSEDYEIRMFRGERCVREVTEIERVVGLCNMGGGGFGYALALGTVGVYDGTKRKWRAKTKNECTAIAGYDLDGDGVPELVSGWSNGRIEVRNERDGKVVYKDSMGSAVAGLVRADYRRTGTEEIVCCAADGEVRAYRTSRDDRRADLSTADESIAGPVLGAPDMSEADRTAEAIRELTNKRRALQSELGNLETSIKQAGKESGGTSKRRFTFGSKGGSGSAGGSNADAGTPPAADRGADLLPPKTTVTADVVVNSQLRCIELVVSTNNDAVIRSVVLFADRVFQGESHVHYPAQAATLVKVPVRPPRDVASEVRIHVMVGRVGAENFHVFELSKTLPRFSMYLLREPGFKLPIKDGVRFTVPERVPRFVMWLDGAFAIDFSTLVADSIDVVFTSLRTGDGLQITVNTTSEGTEVAVLTESMALAAAVVQDMCEFLKVAELNSEASFEKETRELRERLERVEGYNKVRTTLSVSMAESAAHLKQTLVRAEDARLRCDIPDMRGHYRTLAEMNRALCAEYAMRTANHEELLESLRSVNAVIQSASCLRNGSAKLATVQAARAAVKQNNMAALFRIIATGKA